MGGHLRPPPAFGRQVGRRGKCCWFAAAAFLVPGTGFAQLTIAAPAMRSDCRDQRDADRLCHHRHSSIDSISRAGIAGISRFLTDRRRSNRGRRPVSTIETDELSLLSAALLAGRRHRRPCVRGSAVAHRRLHAAGRVGAFRYTGQYGRVCSTVRQPRHHCAARDPGGMNVPPLEPVPDNHVPPRHSLSSTNSRVAFRAVRCGSRRWAKVSRSRTPRRQGDGVTPILITANDFAGALAGERQPPPDARPCLPTRCSAKSPCGPASHHDVNADGNYKSDQVHVPAILERLGQ